MNILILSWRGPHHPSAGGAEIVTHEHAKGWIKAGHNVTLFTSTFNGAKGEETLDGVNIKRSGSQVFGVHLAAFIWYFFDKHPKYDLIIDQFHGIPFFTPLYASIKKLALIHEITKEVWRINPWRKPFSFIPAVLGTIFEPLIFKLFYKDIPFMTVSESTKKDLIAWNIPSSNITVIHDGFIKPEIKKLSPKEKNKTIIYLGVLTKDKGVEEAIKVFSKLEKINKNWQFWVVGKSDPRYFNKLKGMIRKIYPASKIKFWGYVDERKKFELLSRAHILINPSIREGWGLVVIEAAYVGTPTIAFDVPGLRDSIINGRTGILCSQKSIESLTNNIVDLLKDERKLENMSKNAIIWSKNFSWEKSTNMSLKLIENLVYE